MLIIGTLVAAVAPAVINFGLSKLAGGGSKDALGGLDKVPLPTIDAGGVRGKGGVLTTTAARKALVGGLAQTFRGKAGRKRDLASLVRPGFSRLREVRLQQIEAGRRSAIGNLRENLQRRRVLGSSFAGDALSRTEAQFAREKELTEAQTFIQEIELTNQFVNEEFAASGQAFQTELDEQNLLVKTATSLLKGTAAEEGKNLREKAKIGAEAAKGLGKFIEPIGAAIGGLVSGGGGVPIPTRNPARA